jgi:hypothetical protein
LEVVSERVHNVSLKTAIQVTFGAIQSFATVNATSGFSKGSPFKVATGGFSFNIAPVEANGTNFAFPTVFSACGGSTFTIFCPLVSGGWYVVFNIPVEATGTNFAVSAGFRATAYDGLIIPSTIAIFAIVNQVSGAAEITPHTSLIFDRCGLRLVFMLQFGNNVSVVVPMVSAIITNFAVHTYFKARCRSVLNPRSAIASFGDAALNPPLISAASTSHKFLITVSFPLYHVVSECRYSLFPTMKPETIVTRNPETTLSNTGRIVPNPRYCARAIPTVTIFDIDNVS